MYAAVTMVKMKPGHYDDMHAIATSAPNSLRAHKGFISAVYYSDKEKDEYGATTVWETKEDYEAFWNSVASQATEQYGPMMREPAVMNGYLVNSYFTPG